MKRLLLLLAFFVPVAALAQSTDNTLYVKSFQGTDVGAKVATAMQACTSDTSVPCLLVIDPSLAKFAAGTIPTLCANCYLIDFRNGPPTYSTPTRSISIPVPVGPAPAIPPATGIFVVTDAMTTNTCTIGGGSNQNVCLVTTGGPVVVGNNGGSSYPGVTSDGANGIVVAGNMNSLSAMIAQLGPSSTASTTISTPNNIDASITPLNSNFLRTTHNQWAIASLQNFPGGVVNTTQYGIGTSYSITAWSSSASTQLVAFTTSAATYRIGDGQPVLISGLTTGAQFNGQVGIVVANPQSTTTGFSVQFPFAVTTASATEAGTAVIQAAQLHIDVLEDSTGNFHSGEQVAQMSLAFPGVGVNQSTTGGLTIGGGVGCNGGWACPSGPNMGVTATSACFTDGVSACAPNGGTPLAQDFTHFPNGEGWVIYSGGSLSTSVQNTMNQMIVLMETDPSSGTYTIQTNNNGAGFVNAPDGQVSHTGSATGAVGTGISYVYAYSTPAPYLLKVSVTSGNLYVYALGENNTTTNGVMPFSESIGGATLANYGTFPAAILQNWHAALRTHLMFYEAKNNGISNPSGDCSKASSLNPTTYIPFPTLLANTFQSFTGASTLALMDIVYIGTYDIGDHCAAFQNDSARNYLATATPQGVYFDGYFQSTMAQMTGPLLNQAQIGNVHYGLGQQGAVGDALAQYLGYMTWPTSTVPNPVSTSTVDVNTRLGFRDTTSGTTGQKWAMQFLTQTSLIIQKIESDLMLENLDGTGIACFGSNFTSCPTGAAQFSKGNFAFYGITSDPANFSFGGSATNLVQQTTTGFIFAGHIIDIKNNTQIGGLRLRINGTDQWIVGMNGNCSAGSGSDYTLCDKVNGHPIVDIPVNTAPAKSISANSNGISLLTLNTNTNCSSSASPGVCAAAASGSVTVAAAATTEVVNTTAVTANSQILINFDSSLGSKLGVTCNTTNVAAWPSARTAGTSFTITVASAPTTNPACFSYSIVN